MTCETCRFWKQTQHVGGEAVGECRLHPPTIIPSMATPAREDSDVGEDVWFATRSPMTNNDHWCGQWARK